MWLADEWSNVIDHAGVDRGNLHMDAIHVELIYSFVMATKPGRVLEIGSYRGYSTSALVQAQLDGWEGHFVCVDRLVTASLFCVLGQAQNWSLAGVNSWDLLEWVEPVDVVILDG